MKKILWFVLHLLLCPIRLVWTIDAKKNFQKIQNILHTAWIRESFAMCGKDCLFGCDLRVRGGKKIFLGEGVRVDRHCHLIAIETYIPSGQTFSPKITIGNHCYFNEYTHIAAINSIRIGNGVQIGRFVLISDHSHGRTDTLSDVRPAARDLISKGPIVIGDNVWIGDKATICANVQIGKNAIVGANTVVTKNIPPNTVVAGNPARIIRVLG